MAEGGRSDFWLWFRDRGGELRGGGQGCGQDLSTGSAVLIELNTVLRVLREKKRAQPVDVNDIFVGVGF
jgi:hypothetical protein